MEEIPIQKQVFYAQLINIKIKDMKKFILLSLSALCANSIMITPDDPSLVNLMQESDEELRNQAELMLEDGDIEEGISVDEVLTTLKEIEQEDAQK